MHVIYLLSNLCYFNNGTPQMNIYSLQPAIIHVFSMSSITQLSSNITFPAFEITETWLSPTLVERDRYVLMHMDPCWIHKSVKRYCTPKGKRASITFKPDETIPVYQGE